MGLIDFFSLTNYLSSLVYRDGITSTIRVVEAERRINGQPPRHEQRYYF